MVSIIERLNLIRLRRWGLRSDTFRGPHGEVHWMDGPGQGQAPPLVLVHGLSSQATQYRKLVAHLRQDHQRLVLPDLLAHGWSERPTERLNTARVYAALRDLLDDRLGEPAVLFGNSLGGYLAMRYASERPERVRALVVHSPGGGPLPPPRREELLNRFRLHDHRRALELVDRSLTDIGKLRHLAAFMVRQQFARPQIRLLLDSVTEEDEFTPAHLERLTMPVLLMWGQRDRVLEEEQLKFFQHHLPSHARVERPPDYGHTPHLERDRDLAQRIRSFLQEAQILRQG